VTQNLKTNYLCNIEKQSMAIATEKWSKTPSQMELDFKLKAPKIIPAKMAPIVSGSGLPK
jgi:hypothetical protein